MTALSIHPTPVEPPHHGDGGRRVSSAAWEVARADRMGASARLEIAVAALPGPRHAVNEDAHSDIEASGALFVVADGVGGGAMAARASRELVARLHARLGASPIDEQAIGAALLDADLAIAHSIAAHTDELGAATVALVASVAPDFSRWLLAWVGDCRVYRVSAGAPGAVELLTRDDSYRHLAETPPPGGSPDDPARMIGNGAVTAPNVACVDLALDATLVLCSDGVHGRLTATDLAELLHASPLHRDCASVVRLARDRGGTDDATVLAIRRIALKPAPHSLENAPGAHDEGR